MITLQIRVIFRPNTSLTLHSFMASQFKHNGFKGMAFSVDMCNTLFIACMMHCIYQQLFTCQNENYVVLMCNKVKLPVFFFTPRIETVQDLQTHKGFCTSDALFLAVGFFQLFPNSSVCALCTEKMGPEFHVAFCLALVKFVIQAASCSKRLIKVVGILWKEYMSHVVQVSLSLHDYARPLYSIFSPFFGRQRLKILLLYENLDVTHEKKRMVPNIRPFK